VRSWYLRAVAAEQRGEVEDAERAWEWVVRLDGHEPWAHLGLGGFLERQGRWDEALDAYRAATVISPDLPEAELGIGRILVGRGFDDEALPHLQAAAVGDDPDALQLLGRLLVRSGDLDAATTVYEEWFARPVTRGDEHLDRARLAVALQRHGEAVDDLVAALEAGGAAPVTGELLVDAARRSCRVGTAWRWAYGDRVAERSDPGWRRIVLAIGRSARDAQMVEAALRPGEGLETEVLQTRVDLLTAAGRFDEALAAIRAAQTARPDDLGLLVSEGRVLRAAGHSEQALATWERIPLEHAYGPTAARERAALRLALGEPTAALEVVDAALEVHPESAVLGVGRAKALQALGEVEAAEQAMGTLPGWPEAERWRRVASLRRDRGDLAGAEEALLRGVEVGHAPSVRDLARLHHQAGDGERALEAWHRLVALDPGDATAWVAIAELSPPERAAALQQALEADPCQVDALLLGLEEISGCPAVPDAERAADAAPLVPQVLRVLGAAYHACGVDLRHQGDLAGVASQAEGLRQVERTWWVLGEEGAAREVAAKRRELEP
jgi:tetratricopeptide (TPR) repeat protein